MDNRHEILLESGTNELEIVEFGIGQNRFGINVMKVREIINPAPVTQVPQSHPLISGIIKLRGEVLPVIDLAKSLNFPSSSASGQDKFIVTEFNQQKVIFHVHSVMKIRRVSWDQIEKPSEMYQGPLGQVIGVIKLEDDMILLLDFEKIVVDINPETGIHLQKIEKLEKIDSRADKRLVIAEDSPLLRNLLRATLEEAGFRHLTFFENGKDALEYLENIVKQNRKVEDEVHLVITDIEMPQMDGHHLTKRIKDNDQLAVLPVVIFSSLITDSLLHKGEIVGADAQVSKPQIDELVLLIDKIAL